jgi:hypothetical protein
MSIENDWEPDMSVPFPGSPDDMMNTIAALRARVAKLEAALRPFAKEGAKWNDHAPHDLHPSIASTDAMYLGDEAEFTIGDFRAARAALKDAH